MRKFLLTALAGLAIVFALPHSGSASPLMPAGGLAAAVDDIAVTQDVRYRHWHYRHHWRHHHHWRHYGWRHHRHWRHYGWRHHRHWRHYGWRHHRWHHRRHWARYY